MQEMRVFIWKNGKAQAQLNYNDDLLIAAATALFVRDTALKLRQQGIDLARAQLSSFSNLNSKNQAIMTTVGKMQKNPPRELEGRGELTTTDVPQAYFRPSLGFLSAFSPLQHRQNNPSGACAYAPLVQQMPPFSLCSLLNLWP